MRSASWGGAQSYRSVVLAFSEGLRTLIDDHVWACSEATFFVPLRFRFIFWKTCPLVSVRFSNDGVRDAVFAIVVCTYMDTLWPSCQRSSPFMPYAIRFSIRRWQSSVSSSASARMGSAASTPASRHLVDLAEYSHIAVPAVVGEAYSQ